MVATIDPIAVTGTVAASDVISMVLHRRALFIIQSGAVFGSANILIHENNSATFTTGTATIISGITATVITAASQFLFEVSAEAMGDGMTYLRADLTGLTPTNVISGIVLADVERYAPASNENLGTTQIVAVAN